MQQNLLVFDAEPTEDKFAVLFGAELAANGVRYRETDKEITIGPARISITRVAGSIGERLRRCARRLARPRPDMEVNWNDDD